MRVAHYQQKGLAELAREGDGMAPEGPADSPADGLGRHEQVAELDPLGVGCEAVESQNRPVLALRQMELAFDERAGIDRKR